MEFQNISLKEGIRLSRDKENYILMDVREKDRYKEGHLEYAVSYTHLTLPTKRIV